MRRFSLLTVVCSVFFAVSASAYPANPIGAVWDEMIGSSLLTDNPYLLSPGNPTNEADWLSDLLGADVYWTGVKDETGEPVPYLHTEIWKYAVIVQGVWSFAYENTNPDYWLDPNPNDLTGIYWGLNVDEDPNVPLHANFPNPNGSTSHISFFSSTPVPEPATMLLFGTGLICLAGLSLRKRVK